MDAELNNFITEYGQQVKVRNAAGADGMYDAIYHAAAELRQPTPNLRYVQRVLERALPKF